MVDDDAQPGVHADRWLDGPEREWGFADRLGDMISAHAPDGTYRYVSAAARDLLGYEPAELVGTWAYDLFHPDDVSKVGTAHRSTLGGAPVTVVYRLRRRDGDYIWVETTNKVEIDEESGDVIEILCCTRAAAHHESGAAIEEHEREAIVERVRDVLAHSTIEPVFQPIVDLRDGRTIAYEALSRFPGPAAHPPDRWFADAWRVGFGVPLELLAAQLAAAALPRLPSTVGLSVNASPSAVAAPGFLRCFHGNAHRTVVEITEHRPMHDFDQVRLKLASLREAGGAVAIDDFGAGYASFRHLVQISPEWIKLDNSLIERLAEESLHQAMVSAVASFAERAGMRVVAEGVERASQVEMLQILGVRFAQGYHFGRPTPLDEALAASHI